MYSTCTAQTSKPDTIYAYFTGETIRLDGRLDEEAWQQAAHISNFTQRELNVGQLATERTEVAMVYTSATLYLGFWGSDSRTERQVARELDRKAIVQRKKESVRFNRGGH